jgi:hypothetical protein
MQFAQSPSGLYHHDTASIATGVTLVSTVGAHKCKYSNDDYSRAVITGKIQVLIGQPSLREFLRIVDRLLLNGPINRSNVLATEDILGPEIGSPLEGSQCGG